MELSNRAQFSFIFFLNIWRNFLCCPDCPQMKRIPLITISPTIKVQILPVMACWKALWISHLPKKFLKIQWQIGIMVVCPKSLNSIYRSHSPLGVNNGDFRIKFLLKQLSVALASNTQNIWNMKSMFIQSRFLIWFDLGSLPLVNLEGVIFGLGRNYSYGGIRWKYRNC
jgi:hypothetical protein